MLSKRILIPEISDRENLQRYIDGEDSYVSMKNVKHFHQHHLIIKQIMLMQY